METQAQALRVLINMLFFGVLSKPGSFAFGLEVTQVSSKCHRQGEKTPCPLDGAGEPAGGQSQGDHNKDDVKNEHDPAHGLRHPPLEGEDGDEHQHQHQEQHADVAAHP